MLSMELIDSKLSADETFLGEVRISTLAASYIGICDMKSVSSRLVRGVCDDSVATRAKTKMLKV